MCEEHFSHGRAAAMKETFSRFHGAVGFCYCGLFGIVAALRLIPFVFAPFDAATAALGLPAESWGFVHHNAFGHDEAQNCLRVAGLPIAALGTYYALRAQDVGFMRQTCYMRLSFGTVGIPLVLLWGVATGTSNPPLGVTCKWADSRAAVVLLGSAAWSSLPRPAGLLAPPHATHPPASTHYQSCSGSWTRSQRSGVCTRFRRTCAPRNRRYLVKRCWTPSLTLGSS